MKKIILSSVALFVLSGQAYAMQLKGETLAETKVYKTTASAVEKTMKKMGYDYTIDKDGDIQFKINNGKWDAYVIFNRLSSSKKIWNLQVVAQFSTKRSHYDELITFANKWNADKKFPKVTMIDRDSLRLVMNYPVEYGFNPDEFETNIIEIFESTVKQVMDKTDAMRQ